MYQSRKSRGKTQKIYMVDNSNIDDLTKTYDVMGTSGNIYTVTVSNKPTCTCPDFMSRGKRCKHIYFVLIRIMKVDSSDEDQGEYSNDEIKNMFGKIPDVINSLTVSPDLKDKWKNMKGTGDKKSIEISQKPLDDVCPVCIDDLDNGESLVYCKFSCGKNIHKSCFDQWCKVKKEKKCIFCFKQWDKIKENYEYINLL